SACGACPAEDRLKKSVPRPRSPPPLFSHWEELQSGKKNPRPFTLTLLADDDLRFADRGFFPRAAARCLMNEDIRFIPAYLRPGPTYPGSEFPVAGRLEATLYFRNDAPQKLLDRLDEPHFLKSASRHAMDFRIIHARPGEPEEAQEEEYRLLFPPGTRFDQLQNALILPKKGSPLPLKMTRTPEGALYTPEGRKARRCPIREAKILEPPDRGLELHLRVKSSFNPAIIVTRCMGRSAMQAVVRRC
ncbi:MAG: hypothetical protein KJ645_06490, partial [Planctomycetes bacterium]|nr:hypothetical protein [Planctomycetota bacterium]